MRRAGALVATIATLLLGGSDLRAAPADRDDGAIASSDEQPERYSFSAQVPELEVGTRGEVRVAVQAAEDYLLDREFPFELSFVPAVSDEHLAAKKTKLEAKDGTFSEDGKSLAWGVEVAARKTGSHPVDVKIKLRVCHRDPDLADCIVASAEMRLSVVVKG